LRGLRLQDGEGYPQQFNFPPLDQLLDIISENRPQTGKTHAIQTIIEFLSLAPGGGKTHLLYHLSALAVLSRKYGGKQACVVIIDTDGKLSVIRTAEQIQLLLRKQQPPDSEGDWPDEIMREELFSALKHIHIFRPQSLASTIATINSLPTYLFNPNQHYSFDREVAFIALDSAAAFYWQDRSETEDAAFLTKTTTPNTPGQTSAYFRLATALKSAMKTFDCPAIFTSWYLGPQQREGDGTIVRSFRPQILPLQADLRLVVHRLPVRKFPAGLRLEGALREAGVRQKAVEEGKFECFVNELGLEERILRRLNGCGFAYRIVDDGLLVEEAMGNERA
jgi:DNA-repair protein XRCC2